MMMNKMTGMWLIILLASYTASAQVQIHHPAEDSSDAHKHIRLGGLSERSTLPENDKIDTRWRTLSDDHIHTFHVRGQTKHYLPSGSWTWEEGLWNYTISAGTHARPVFTSFGIKKKWAGRLNQGIPDGLWTFTADSIGENGRVIRTLARIRINYNKGIPSGSIYMESDLQGHSLKMSGRADKHGLASGTWTYQYTREGKKSTEQRQYRNGLLMSISSTENGRTTVHALSHNQHLDNEPDDNDVPARQTGSYKFLEDEYSTPATIIIHELLTGHYQKGWNTDIFPHHITLSAPHYHRTEYPLSIQEKDDINICRQLIEKQRSDIQQHLSGHIHIHRSRSETLDTTIAYLQLQDKRLELMDSLIKKTEDPLFTYKNRFEQGARDWAYLLNQYRITQGELHDTLIIEIPAITVPAIVPNIYSIFKNILSDNEETLPHYFHIIEETQFALKKEGRLKSLEDTISTKFEMLQNYYADRAGIASVINTKWLKGDIQSLWQIYANTSDHDSALDIAITLQSRLDSLASWSSLTDEYDSIPHRLREQYSYMVYNPYTGQKDIEVVVKRRFLNNILNRMWPYMTEELKNENDWNTWIERWHRQFTIYHFLLEFVQAEGKSARRLENRIRRDNKPSKMIHLLLNHIDNKHK